MLVVYMSRVQQLSCQSRIRVAEVGADKLSELFYNLRQRYKGKVFSFVLVVVIGPYNSFFICFDNLCLGYFHFFIVGIWLCRIYVD